jgi:hypothetical protein
LVNWVLGWFGTTWEDVVKQWESNWEMFKIIVNTAIRPITDAIDGIGDAIRGVIDWIKRMADRLSSIRLPSWLTPGSPTPFELGLRGIADAMRQLPTEALRMSVTGGAAAGGGAPALAGAGGGAFSITVNIGSVSEGNAYNAGQQAGLGIVDSLRRQGVIV